MTRPASSGRAKFSIGDLIGHRLYDYRGVIVDIDASFQSTDDWYDTMAKSRPPKDKPWYHVLVDGATHTTYVAERHLQRDETLEPIVHPLLTKYFSRFDNGRYFNDARVN